MKQRYKLKCAVCLILTKIENDVEYILLQKRMNTGVLDGRYDVSCAGHLEKNETLIEAVIRETKEEIGITVKKEDLQYISTMHANFKGDEYILVAFNTNKYLGQPKIMETDKCSELKWCDINHLPKELADTRRLMIDDYKTNNRYREYGFNKRK